MHLVWRLQREIQVLLEGLQVRLDSLNRVLLGEGLPMPLEEGVLRQREQTPQQRELVLRQEDLVRREVCLVVG